MDGVVHLSSAYSPYDIIYQIKNKQICMFICVIHRVNFMKYEKPPPALDHLQNSEVYKAIHEMDQKPLKKVEMLKPAIAASDYVKVFNH